MRLCCCQLYRKLISIANVSSGVLKDTFLVMLPQLVYMFDLSFNSNTFHGSWKVANIIPLHKLGDPTDVNNLRPISLLPLVPGKMIEHIVHTQLSGFLEDNELYSERQGGFRKGRSTTATVANFTDDILTGMKDKQYTVATFIDLKKAFDTVNHKIRLQKLPHYGLSPNIIAWIRSYLLNRSQCCTVNRITSSNLEIKCGVPQGSILGPLLFLLYINDLQDKLSHPNVYLYADDTVIYSTNEDLRLAHYRVQTELNHVLSWCEQNQLTINTKKTKAMVFGTNNMIKRAHQPPIILCNSELQYVTSFNYLGIKLDNKLNYELHAQECVAESLTSYICLQN